MANLNDRPDHCAGEHHTWQLDELATPSPHAIHHTWLVSAGLAFLHTWTSAGARVAEQSGTDHDLATRGQLS